MIKYTYLGIVVVLLSLSSVSAVVFPGAAWEERTPEQVGMDSTKVNEFISLVGGHGVLIKDGYLIATWGSPTYKYKWASAAKPVMSTLLFFSVEDGHLQSVDDLVDPYVYEVYGTHLQGKDTTMTYRHLANMVGGYRRPEAPGEAWAYNDYGIGIYFNTFIRGVHDSSKSQTEDVFMSYLSALNFQDPPLWYNYTLRATPRDFARIGWFWLNKGNWDGQQLLPESYFDEYMKPDVPVDLPRTSGSQGTDYIHTGKFGGGSDQTPHGPGVYGFNWWFNDTTPSGQRVWPDAPADLIMANGNWNKRAIVIIPSLGIVAAANSADWGHANEAKPLVGPESTRRLKLLKEAVLDTKPVGHSTH